jgi:uncharacterized protein (TIGR03790 family)
MTKLLKSNIVKFSLFFLAIFLSASSSQAATDCHLLNSTTAIPGGYGAVFNVFSTNKELLAKVLCDVSGVDVEVGSGLPAQYVYKYAYLLNGTNWEKITLSPVGSVSGDWMIGKAKTRINLSPARLAQENQLLVYTCTSINSQWKCGCKDSTCSTSNWQLQKFKSGVACSPKAEICGNSIDEDCDGKDNVCADATRPVVTLFSVSPTIAEAGKQITINYSVTDNLSLAKIELWRATQNVSTCPTGKETSCVWEKKTEKTISGTSDTGTLPDLPTIGTYWYGVHVLDAVGNVGYEPSVSGAIKIGSGCADTSWTPLADTYCSGMNFQQTSNCGNTRTSAGTKPYVISKSRAKYKGTELDCFAIGRDFTPQKWFEEKGRCIEIGNPNTSLPYWIDQISKVGPIAAKTAFDQSYFNECQSLYATSNPDICNDKALCATGDDYVRNTEFCQKVNAECAPCEDVDADTYDKCSPGQAGDDGKEKDCNDNAWYMNPQAPETCDGYDNNCNGQTDEGCDDDNDDYCDKTIRFYNYPVTACPNTNLPNDSFGDDCDDVKNTIKPEATDVCDNKVDENCDGEADKGCPPCIDSVWSPTADTVCNGFDVEQTSNCANTRMVLGTKAYTFTAYPAKVNRLYTLNCPIGIPSAHPQTWYYEKGRCPTTDDIWYWIDQASKIGPIAAEQAFNSSYQSSCVNTYGTSDPAICNDKALCNAGDNYVRNTERCQTVDAVACKGESACTDTDGDSYDNCSPGKAGDDGKAIDCNDNEKHAYPGNLETCDMIDNDCNGTIDDNCDQDRDGYCNKTKQMYRNNTMCPNTPFQTEGQNGNDCNDTSSTIKPNATEVCSNSLDDNCNGQVDENCQTGTTQTGTTQTGTTQTGTTQTGTTQTGTTQTGTTQTGTTQTGPLLSIWPETGQSFNKGTTIWFTASLSGATSPYKFLWKSSIDGSLRTSEALTSNADSLSLDNLSVGVHSIELTVEYGSGKTISKTIQTTIKAIEENEEQVRCSSYVDCNDSNACTSDVCTNPGLISSYCTNSQKTVCQNSDSCCPSACNSSNDNDCAVSADNDDPAKVLVVYNDKCATDNNKNGVKDYYELAMYYKQKRNIPDKNMLAVTPNVGSSGCASYYYQATSYPAFYADIVLAVQNKLKELGENNIYYLNLIGLPSTIYTDINTRSLDQALITLNDIKTSANYYNYWDYCNSSEYCEIYYGSTLRKPRFNHTFKYNGGDVYLVTRVHDLNLIDRALYGEKYIYNEAGYYRGRGYVDTRYGVYTDTYLDSKYPGFSDSSSYAQGDRKMAYGKRIFETKGWDYKWESAGTEIGESGAKFTDSSNAEFVTDAMWYEGWYNFGRYIDAWQWKAGAVACDLNSDSGVKFLQGAFQKGLTAGVGVTGEPYLNGHPEPEVFIHYMLSGYNFAESAMLSYPGYKWRDIAYGDPLYNPNKAGKAKVKDTENPSLLQVIHESNSANTATSVNIIVRLDMNKLVPDVATFKVEYGLTSSYGSIIDYNEVYSIERKIVLNNLSPNTSYHYRVSAKDPVGNTVTSGDNTFKTSSDKTVLPSTITASASVNNGTAPLSVNFSSTFGTTPSKIEWNFADNSTESVQNPSHTFSKGFYSVVLHAEFPNGLSANKELLIIAK